MGLQGTSVDVSILICVMDTLTASEAVVRILEMIQPAPRTAPAQQGSAQAGRERGPSSLSRVLGAFRFAKCWFLILSFQLGGDAQGGPGAVRPLRPWLMGEEAERTPHATTHPSPAPATPEVLPRSSREAWPALWRDLGLVHRPGEGWRRLGGWCWGWW